MIDGVQWGRLGWPALTPEDVLANLAVYLPVGAAFALLLARKLPGVLAAAGATASAVTLSFALESVQTVLATRYPSWSDVVLNGIGAAVGAALMLAAQDAGRRGALLVARILRSITRWGWPIDAGLLAAWSVLVIATAADGTRGLLAITTGDASLRVTWLPLIDYFYVPFAVALSWAGELAATYAALACTAIGLIGRLAPRRPKEARLVLGLTIIAAVVGVLEANGRISVSDALIAGLAAIVSHGAARRLWACTRTEVGRRIGGTRAAEPQGAGSRVPA